MNCFRSYTISEQPTLFGETDLIIVWGRLGVRKRLRSESFTDAAARSRRVSELTKRWLRHGYRRVDG